MPLDTLEVDLTVVLGRTQLPLQRFLRLGRGALIALDAGEDDIVEILANGLLVARGKVAVERTTITVEVIELVRKPDVTRVAGATIGDGLRPKAGEMAIV